MGEAPTSSKGHFSDAPATLTPANSGASGKNVGRQWDVNLLRHFVSESNQGGGRHRGTGRLLGEYARQQRQLRQCRLCGAEGSIVPPGDRPLSLPISNMYSIIGGRSRACQLALQVLFRRRRTKLRQLRTLANGVPRNGSAGWQGRRRGRRRSGGCWTGFGLDRCRHPPHSAPH